VDYLKPTDAAKLLNVSYPTIKQWIYGGKIQSIKTPGGHHRIPRAEIERLTGGASDEANEPGRASPKPAAGGHHILVVEDEPGVSGMLTAYLQSLGYEVTITDKGLDAWGYIQRGDLFDLYLLDYKLPDIAGTDLCRLIRERDPLTPVLFFSLATIDEVKDAALKAGAQDFISKITPAHQQQTDDPLWLLRERIDWWLQNPESGQEEGDNEQT
jgi:excisionase family DNA binding protein